MRYLLDTNTCIAVMRHFSKTVQRLSAVSPDDCAISTVTRDELFTGVEKCADPNRERAKVERLLKTIPEIVFSSAAAQEAARIRAVLEAQGQTIGPYDLLLAEQARCLSLIMVSANTKEFSRVSGLVVENWES